MIQLFAFVAVSIVIRLRLTRCRVVFNTLLARARASTRIMWRDWVKRIPSDAVKMMTASTRMPRVSFLEYD